MGLFLRMLSTQVHKQDLIPEDVGKSVGKLTNKYYVSTKIDDVFTAF